MRLLTTVLLLLALLALPLAFADFYSPYGPYVPVPYTTDFPNKTVATNKAVWDLAATALQTEVDPVATVWILNNASIWNLWSGDKPNYFTKDQTNNTAQLAGTAQVTGLNAALATLQYNINGKEPVISAGSPNLFWGWDKTWRDPNLTVNPYILNWNNITQNLPLTYPNTTLNNHEVNKNYTNDSLQNQIISLQINLSNITMITANGSIVASNLPDGYGNITNVTVSGGLIATWI